eukprot:scaffold177083_cov19-Prasinocladus_malaysianus.AAC.1
MYGRKVQTLHCKAFNSHEMASCQTPRQGRAEVESRLVANVEANRHPWLREAAEAGVVAAAVACVLDAIDSFGSLVSRGRAWAHLGALRLLLVRPPPGLDPVGKHHHKKIALASSLTLEVRFSGLHEPKLWTNWCRNLAHLTFAQSMCKTKINFLNKMLALHIALVNQ